MATVDISRGYLHKRLSATMEFIVESDKGMIVLGPNLYSLFLYVNQWSTKLLVFFFVENSADLQQQPLSPEMAIFYITQDTQRHPLLPELKSGMLIYLQSFNEYTCSLGVVKRLMKRKIVQLFHALISHITSCNSLSSSVVVLTLLWLHHGKNALVVHLKSWIVFCKH